MNIHVGVCVRMGTRQSCEAGSEGPLVIHLMWFECGGGYCGQKGTNSGGDMETGKLESVEMNHQNWAWKCHKRTSYYACLLNMKKTEGKKSPSQALAPIFSSCLLLPEAIMFHFKEHCVVLGDKDPCVIVWSYKWFKLVRILIAMKWLYYLLLIRGL